MGMDWWIKEPTRDEVIDVMVILAGGERKFFEGGKG